LILSQQIQTILLRDTLTIAETLALETSSARIEAQCLLQKILNVPRVYLLTHPEQNLTEAEYKQYGNLLQRRLAGEPIAYILGAREFFGINLKVTTATLIPRPDTELLVEQAMLRIAPDMQYKVLDLGTGSGAIALALALQRPLAQVTACEYAQEALAVAQENARTLDIKNVHFVHSNWFAALEKQRFSLIVSNPPYIATGDPHLAQGDVRFEPETALVSGVDGLDDIRHIIVKGILHLQPGGWLLLEHGYDQAARVRALLQQAGYVAVYSACDLSGTERVSGGQFPL
jgi:release factor glutamine methyltransferase